MGFTERSKVAKCSRELEAPVKVTARLLAAGARGTAENVTCSGVPGVRVILVGDTETPAGSPLIFTLIWAENPSIADADKETDVWLPAFTV